MFRLSLSLILKNFDIGCIIKAIANATMNGKVYELVKQINENKQV